MTDKYARVRLLRPAAKVKGEFLVGEPLLFRKIDVPEPLRHRDAYGGDVRIGDVNGDSAVDFVVYRSTDRSMKPCSITAFDANGKMLWRDGEGGEQPAWPGPVTIYDIDGDGADEVIRFFLDKSKTPDVSDAGGDQSMADVAVQVRDGKTGRVLRQAAPMATLFKQQLSMTPGEYRKRNLKSRRRVEMLTQ